MPPRPKEFDLLLALARRAGELVTRRELLAEVWGYQADVVSRTVDTHLAELRRELGHMPAEPGYIQTVARTGYRIQGDRAEARLTGGAVNRSPFVIPAKAGIQAHVWTPASAGVT